MDLDDRRCVAAVSTLRPFKRRVPRCATWVRATKTFCGSSQPMASAVTWLCWRRASRWDRRSKKPPPSVWLKCEWRRPSFRPALSPVSILKSRPAVTWFGWAPRAGASCSSRPKIPTSPARWHRSACRRRWCSCAITGTPCSWRWPTAPSPFSSATSTEPGTWTRRLRWWLWATSPSSTCCPSALLCTRLAGAASSSSTETRPKLWYLFLVFYLKLKTRKKNFKEH